MEFKSSLFDNLGEIEILKITGARFLVSDFVSDLGRVIRKWGEERYMPVRQQVDEDWRDHRVVEPLLKEVLVDLGINAAFFPAEVDRQDIGTT